MKTLQKFLIVILFLLVTVSYADPACLDYTGFDESDSGSNIAVTADTLTVTNLSQDANSYIRYDYGDGGIGVQFVYYVTVEWTSLTGTGNAIVCPWAISAGDRSSLLAMSGAADGLEIELSRIGGVYRVIARSYEDSGDIDYYQYGSIPGPRYLKISRSGTVYTVQVYTDALRTSLEATLNVVTSDATTYRYLYGTIGYGNVGNSTTVSYTVNCTQYERLPGNHVGGCAFGGLRF